MPPAAKTWAAWVLGVLYSALKQIGRAVRTHIPSYCPNSSRYITPQEYKLKAEWLRDVGPTIPAQGPSFPQKAETSALKESQNIQPSSLSPALVRATCPKKGKTTTGQVCSDFPVHPKKMPGGLQFKDFPSRQQPLVSQLRWILLPQTPHVAL